MTKEQICEEFKNVIDNTDHSIDMIRNRLILKEYKQYYLKLWKSNVEIPITTKCSNALNSFIAEKGIIGIIT